MLDISNIKNILLEVGWSLFTCSALPAVCGLGASYLATDLSPKMAEVAQ